MKYIELTRGKVAIVDDEDFERLNQLKWHVTRFGYAGHWFPKKKYVFMHNLIQKVPIGMQPDHINRNKLDNRKCNLRICTKSENNINKSLHPCNTSGFRGVHFYKSRKKWQAYINKDSKRTFLGYFKTKEEAALVYNNFALKYFGEFAVLNKL
jgi:hypothetical protein